MSFGNFFAVILVFLIYTAALFAVPMATKDRFFWFAVNVGITTLILFVLAS